MPNYKRIITKIYDEILGRPADPGGLDSWDKQMNAGKAEAEVREAFLRSEEYKTRFPSEVTPPPPPPPVPGGPMALRVQGNKFVNAGGAVVRLMGAVSCCADPDADCGGAIEYGWPLVNTLWLDLQAAHKLNLAHNRLGPMVNKNVDPDGEPLNDVQAYALAPSGKQYDLDRWDEAYWTRLRALIAYAQARGIYFQCDIADTWVMQHRHSPWVKEYNIQGYEGADLAVMRAAPQPRHEQWIRKIVRETCGYDNVLLQDGNESFKAASEKWVLGMRDIVRDEQARMGVQALRPFGTNCQNEDIEKQCDYGVWHEQSAPTPATIPRMTNEYADMPPEAVLAEVRGAWATEGAVTFQYWRGDHNCETFKATLAEITKIISGESPVDIPADCPPYCRVGLRIYSVLDSAFGLLPEPEGGWKSGQTLPNNARHVVCDMTPRFGTGRGLPCNEEHNEACGGRKCEDPRGGLWTLEAGATSHPLHLQSNDFQCRVVLDGPGHYALRARPRPDSHDYYGKPHNVTEAARNGSLVEWNRP